MEDATWILNLEALNGKSFSIGSKFRTIVLEELTFSSYLGNYLDLFLKLLISNLLECILREVEISVDSNGLKNRC